MGAGALCLLMFSASCVPAGSENRLAIAHATLAQASAPSANAAPPPPPEPTALQPLAPAEAVAMNAAMPVVPGYNPAARPFVVRGRSMIDQMRSLDCLTAAIYYEAASESDDGQRAVAQVVLNRVRHPTYPSTVCGVVYQGSERSTGCQFSFTCDGSLMRTPSVSGWARARRTAAAALAGSVYAPVGHATHYHTHAVLPYWAASLVKSAVIGAHIFYRWNGGWGTPRAFRQPYVGREPMPGPKPSEATALLALKPLKADFSGLIQAEIQQARTLTASAPALAGHRADPVEANAGGPRLPESHVLEAYRYSGVPRDELPPSVAGSTK